MTAAKDAVVWANDETYEVMVLTLGRVPEGNWCDPIGAAYAEWDEMSDKQRVDLMLETVIDLGMQGFSLKTILKAFAQVDEFYALGRASYPMCRALTAALIGKSLEPNTMSFDELIAQYL